MKLLKQNNLESATTGLGFVRAINENSGAETTALIRETELETGEKVQIEGVTPHGMKKILSKSGAKVEFITPGERYIDSENNEFSGIAYRYNKEVYDSGLEFMPGSCMLFNEGFDTSDIEISHSKILNYNAVNLMVGAAIFNSNYEDATVEVLESKDGENWTISNKLYAALESRVPSIPINNIYKVFTYSKEAKDSIEVGDMFKYRVFDKYNSIESGIITIVEDSVN